MVGNTLLSDYPLRDAILQRLDYRNRNNPTAIACAHIRRKCAGKWFVVFRGRRREFLAMLRRWTRACK